MSEFTFPGNLTTVDYAAFLSQHDLVYLAPAPDGIDGLPIGNGDLGAMVWTPSDRLHLQINKIDLWDDGPEGPFNSWGDAEEESNTMLRSAGALSLGHGLPIFDRLYLTDFAARLHLAEAEVEIRAATPFAEMAAEIFVSKAAGVLVVHYHDWTEEKLPRRIELNRWGSRAFPHWYNKIKRDVPLSLTATQVGCDATHFWICQPLRGMHFAVVARLDGPARPRRVHNQATVCESEPMQEFEGTVYVAAVNSEEANDPLAEARRRVDIAVEQGFVALRQEHRRWWSNFWQASFVDLPPEQDYIENLWYLNSYHLASCCQGRYPPNHIYALWAWNRDVFPWAHYYHWNDQLHAWPVHAIGHGELAMPYYRYRRTMLEHVMKDARRIHNLEGAFYTDVANRKGYQAAREEVLSHNLTPGPQIAADFWRHWQYTRDKDFLKEYAYPVIREVARFYAGILRRREDGRYTIMESQPYEGVLRLRDTLTDLAHARQVFRIFLEASEFLKADGNLRARCREILDNLADYLTFPVSTEYEVPKPPENLPDWGGDAVPVRFKEVKPGDPTMPIWFLGYKVGTSSVHGQEIPNGTLVHEGMRDPARHIWIFTSTNMAPIFPANQVGLDQEGTPEFATAVNTVKALGQDSASFSLYLIARARLGMAEELRKSLENWPQAFQVFPNGFYHYFRKGNPQYSDDNPRTLRRVRVAGTQDEYIYWPMALSNHHSLEGGPMLQLAINEMLLQSYSGTLRVFPAVTKEWEGTFRLHAVGGFVVSAARAEGQATYVIIESRCGEPCRLANPWPGQRFSLYRWEDSRWVHKQELEGKVVAFSTEAEGLYLLLPSERKPETLRSVHFTGQPNRGPKTLGQARLGLPKGF